MTPTILSLQHVFVSRGSAPVLHDINLNLLAGEHLAILGPNGCGKSTLLKTITCELYPLAVAPDGLPSSFSIFGRSRWDLTELRRRLGVVSPELPGTPTLTTTGFDAILTGFFSASTLWPNLSVTGEMRARAEVLLHQVGAENLRHKLVGEMSAGQQRRIMIARALAGSAATPGLRNVVVSTGPRAEPKVSEDTPPFAPAQGQQKPHTSGAPSSSAISSPKRAGSSSGDLQEDSPSSLVTQPKLQQMLLLDEPSNALDISAQRDLRKLLRSLAQAGTAIILITHHTADIIPEISRVLLLREGRITADGPKQDLLTTPILSELFQAPIEVTRQGGFFHTW